MPFHPCVEAGELESAGIRVGGDDGRALSGRQQSEDAAARAQIQRPLDAAAEPQLGQGSRAGGDPHDLEEVGSAFPRPVGSDQKMLKRGQLHGCLEALGMAGEQPGLDRVFGASGRERTVRFLR